MTKIPQPQTKERRYFDREFKSDAVQRVIETGKPASKVADELGIPAGLLARWKREMLRKEDEKAGAGMAGMKPSEWDAENRRLRRELGDMREQRDILKKALSVFARDGSKGMRS